MYVLHLRSCPNKAASFFGARHGRKLWGGSPERTLIVGSVNQKQGMPSIKKVANG